VQIYFRRRKNKARWYSTKIGHGKWRLDWRYGRINWWNVWCFTLIFVSGHLFKLIYLSYLLIIYRGLVNLVYIFNFSYQSLTKFWPPQIFLFFISLDSTYIFRKFLSLRRWVDHWWLRKIKNKIQKGLDTFYFNSLIEFEY
jgi:hypothetical protein